MSYRERLNGPPTTYLITAHQFENVIIRPDAIKRQEDLFNAYQEVMEEARKLDLNDIFLMGSLASPALRAYRPHDDVDIFIPQKDQCTALMKNLARKGYVNERPYVLHGSSLFYSTHPITGIPVEIRYGLPITGLNGTAWAFAQPAWSRIFMPKPLVIPPSALSRPGELRSWWGIETRYVYDEYNWLIKSRSPYPKDQIDAAILSNQGLDKERIQRIINEIAAVRGSLMLPPPLIKLIRGFGFWNLPDEDYRLLHGI